MCRPSVLAVNASELIIELASVNDPHRRRYQMAKSKQKRLSNNMNIEEQSTKKIHRMMNKNKTELK